MIKTISVLSALTLFAASSVPAMAMTEAQIRECQAMGASINVRAGEVKAMKAKRDHALELAEAAGDEWEAAEAVRLFSKAQATEADAKKASYDALKADFMKIDAALISKSGMVNQSIVKYNARCSPAE